MSHRPRGRPDPLRPEFFMRVAALAAAVTVAGAAVARAQSLDAYFPAGIPGYGTQQGVTVLSRQRPLYDEPGVRVGDFVIRPTLDESFGYNSNLLGISGTPGSFLVKTSPAISAYSDWSRDRVGVSLSLDNYAYLNTPRQNETDANVSIGGAYTIGRSDLDLAYSHLSLHQTGTEVGALASDLPIHYSVDDVRTDYTIDLGRLSFVPNVDLSDYNFDNATILGVNTGQQYRDRVVATGGVTTRYELSDANHLLLVLQGVDSHYTQPQPGQPTNNSTSFLAMAGIDYQANGVFRYRLLAGVEHRDFASSTFKSRTAPIVQAGVIWTPTGLTTVTGTVSRTIEDVTAEGTEGYVYNNANIVVDHEYLRNVLLQGRVGFQAAQFLGGGSQDSYSIGGGVTWLLNRHMRLSANYDYVDQHGSSSGNTNGVLTPVILNTGTTLTSAVLNPNTLTTGSYTQSLFLVTLHLGL